MKTRIILIAIMTFSLSAFCQYNQRDFVKSYYYTPDGEKVEGYILFKEGKLSGFTGLKPSHIKFKKDIDSKPIELTANEVSSFIVYKDSFAIIQNANIKYECGMNTMSDICIKDFAKVILTGKINAYLYYSRVNLGTYGVHYNEEIVLSKDNIKYQSFFLKKQKNEFAEFIADNEKLKEYILSTKHKDIAILDVISQYNNASR
ncbi:MAG: hypothetical protein AB7E36_08130 [Salinivirgaceae bacterium]